MKTLLAFMKKEWMEQMRLSRVMVLGILFVLFGIMNPAMAKLTPWLFELMAESLENAGIMLGEIHVTAMDSWVQFYKNIPMALIVFVVMESSCFTKEYQTGTLILALTKGLERYKVVIAKSTVLITLWSAGFWMCYGITYLYNSYFWSNSIASNLLFSAFCWWLFGVWVVFVMVLFSALSNSNTGVMLGTGAVVVAAYLIELLPKYKEYSPSMLMDGNSLIYGMEQTEAYGSAILITVILCVVCSIISIPVMNKKRI